MSSEALKQEIRAALDNTTLARTLGTFCKNYPAKRIKYPGKLHEGCGYTVHVKKFEDYLKK